MLRKEGIPKVTGSARYIDDIDFPEMLYGATVRSTVARGRMKADPFRTRHSLGGVHRRHRERYSRPELRRALIVNDQPCLADQFVNHPEEAVVLLAHPDKYLARRGTPRCLARVRAAAGEFSRSRIRSPKKKSSGARTTFSSPTQ